MRLKFIGSEAVTNSVTSFSFEPAELLTWQPGQYMHYVLPHAHEDGRGNERWFTNSAAPSEGKVMISTRIDAEHGSSFKRVLLALSPGDQIEADGPEGDFTVGNESRNYIFVAGGIGITPFRSILTEAHSKGVQLHVTLLYANRDQDILFRDELEQYAADNPNLHTTYFISPKTLDSTQVKQVADDIENPLVYLSGPEPMVKAFAKELEELGMSKDSLKLDDFPGYETI